MSRSTLPLKRLRFQQWIKIHHHRKNWKRYKYKIKNWKKIKKEISKQTGQIRTSLKCTPPKTTENTLTKCPQHRDGWFGFFVQWYINLCWLSNFKAILGEEQQWHYLIHHCKNKEVNTFPEGISLRVSVIYIYNLWKTIYTLPHGGSALWWRNFRLPLI